MPRRGGSNSYLCVTNDTVFTVFHSDLAEMWDTDSIAAMHIWSNALGSSGVNRMTTTMHATGNAHRTARLGEIFEEDNELEESLNENSFVQDKSKRPIIEDLNFNLNPHRPSALFETSFAHRQFMRRTLGDLERKKMKMELAQQQDPIIADFGSNQDELSKIEEEQDSRQASPKNTAQDGAGEKPKRKITTKFSDAANSNNASPLVPADPNTLSVTNLVEKFEKQATGNDKQFTINERD